MATILPTLNYDPVVFQGSVFQPQQADMSLLANSLSALEARERTANEKASAMDAVFAQMRTNLHEDEETMRWFDEFSSRYKNTVNSFARVGDFGDAINAAVRFANEAAGDPELQARLKSNKDYQEELARQLARVGKGISQNTFQWWEKTNPYHHENIYDNEGKVIAGNGWKPTAPLYDDILSDDFAFKAFQRITAAKNSTTTAVEESTTTGTRTSETGTTTGERHKTATGFTTQHAYERIRVEDIRNHMDEVIKLAPDGFRQLEQTYLVARYDYDRKQEELNEKQEELNALNATPILQRTDEDNQNIARLTQEIATLTQNIAYRSVDLDNGNGGFISYEEYVTRTIADSLFAQDLAYDWRTDVNRREAHYVDTDYSGAGGGAGIPPINDAYVPNPLSYNGPMVRFYLDYNGSNYSVINAANNLIDLYKTKYTDSGYDNSKFNAFLNNHEYTNAANYLRQFKPKDPEQLNSWLSNVRVLEHQGRKLEAVYSRVEPDDYEDMTFYDAFFVDGGLGTIPDNKKAQDWLRYKQMLGTYKVEQLGYTFDSKLDFNSFINGLNLTEQQLRDSGIYISSVGEATTIRFTKDNEYSNLLLFIGSTVSTPIGVADVIAHNLQAWDKDGKEIKLRDIYTKTGHILTAMQTLVNDAKGAHDKYFNGVSGEGIDYSSTEGPWLSDNWNNIIQSNLTEAEKDAKLKHDRQDVINALTALGTGDYEMYSNYKNEDDNDELLVGMNNVSRGELGHIISSIAINHPSNVALSTFVANGKSGAMITLPAIYDSKDPNKLVRKRLQIFVPNLLLDKTQRSIARDTSVRSVLEFNDMQLWDYNYSTFDGSSISVKNGNYTITDSNGNQTTLGSKEDVFYHLNRSMILEDAYDTIIPMSYVNPDGNLIEDKRTEFDNQVVLAAITGAASLYNTPTAVQANADHPIVTFDGQHVVVNGRNYSLSDIFADVLSRDIPANDYKILDDIRNLRVTMSGFWERYKQQKY